MSKAIKNQEEEARIQELLGQCGMLCDDICKLSEQNKKEERSHSYYNYLDAKQQKEAREKALSSTL